MSKKTDDPVGELRQATREAHEAMKDMRALLNMMKDVKDDLLKVSGEVFEERLDATVKEHLDAYTASINDRIGEATQAVYDRFDSLSRILLGKGTEMDLQRSILESAPTDSDWRVVDFTSIPEGGTLTIKKDC